VKHGALSQRGGRVELLWKAQKEELNLSWREIGGPHVVPPSRRGFGSRLLKDGLSRDFEGETRLEFLPEGVCCWITLSRFDRIESDFAASTAAGREDVSSISDGANTDEIRKQPLPSYQPL
jgi:two-component sensor histidine kinase